MTQPPPTGLKPPPESREWLVRQLAEKLAELELLYDTAPVGLALVDTELRYVRINDRLAAMNGRPAAEHIGQRVRDMIPALTGQVEPVLYGVIETGEPANFEVHGFTAADPGQAHDWLLIFYPVRDRDGRVFGVNAVVQDITERTRAQRALEEAHSRLHDRTAELTGALDELQAQSAERQRTHAALQASEERYRTLVETLRDVVFTLDVRGTITYISPAIEPLSGFTPDELIGKRFDEFIHPDDRSEALGSFQRSVAGAIEPLEFRVHSKLGAVRWVRTLSRVVQRPDGGVELRGVLTDVTARRHAEDEARRRQAELAHVQRVATIGEMTAQIAHEINQPLAAIVNFADGLGLRLSQAGVDRAAMQGVAAQIAAEGRRAAEVIRRLREFARKGAFHSEPSDVNRLVREVAGLLEAEVRRHAVALRLHLNDALDEVWLDRVQIQQVIMNLLRNGLDALVAGVGGERRLTVETRPDGARGVLVAVRDTGVGLPAEAEDDRIFDAFFTTKPDGLGIGLAISRSIVEAHGGRLWAERNADRGATFYLSLPRER
jgi:PAS domain S-box-containing protein